MAERIEAFRAADGSIHATEAAADNINLRMIARTVFQCEDYRGPAIDGILNTIVASADNRRKIIAFIKANETPEDEARAAAEVFADTSNALMAKVFAGEEATMLPMTPPASYAFLVVALHRLRDARDLDTYYAQSERFWQFVSDNFTLEFVIMAAKHAMHSYDLPRFNPERQPIFNSIIKDKMGKLIMG